MTRTKAETKGRGTGSRARRTVSARSANGDARGWVRWRNDAAIFAGTPVGDQTIRPMLRALRALYLAADRHTNPHERCPACDPGIRDAVERARRAGSGRRGT